MAEYRLTVLRNVEFNAEITVAENAPEEDVDAAVDFVLEDALSDQLSEGWVFLNCGFDLLKQTSPTTYGFKVWAEVSVDHTFEVADVFDAEENIDEDDTKAAVEDEIDNLLSGDLGCNPMPEGWDIVDIWHEAEPVCQICFTPKYFTAQANDFVIAEYNGGAPYQHRVHTSCAQDSGLSIISGP